jgi:hypothetical protein
MARKHGGRGERKFLYMIHPGNGGDRFLQALAKVDGELEYAKLLLESHKKGWISLLGVTDRDIKDIAAVLQEHFDVEVWRPGENDDDGGQRARKG